jgi:2-methylisocitrate lyase-like PEP mutase family enzyme
VLADGDHGHGNAMNVQRTVSTYGPCRRRRLS